MARGAYQPYADVIANQFYCSFGQPIDTSKLNPFCERPKPRRKTEAEERADTEFFRMQWQSMFPGEDD